MGICWPLPIKVGAIERKSSEVRHTVTPDYVPCGCIANSRAFWGSGQVSGYL